MDPCPHCNTTALVKAGRNPSGSQRYQCKVCRRYHTPQPNPQGYTEAQRRRALELYLEGNGLRRIARLLKMHHQTIANWITQHQMQLPPTPPQPSASAVVELDELYTFVATKKTEFT